MTTADTWEGCYDAGWAGLIVPDAFAHPAKFAYPLVCRIVQHLYERGWVSRGSRVADPFGGVGTGGIVCAYQGLRWRGVELESRFVDLARRNFALHRARWDACGDPPPEIVQGDSRRLADVLGGADAVVSSPPYAETAIAPQPGIQIGPMFREGKHAGGQANRSAEAGYGSTPGNLGNLKPGDVDAVVSSPPYATDVIRERSVDNLKDVPVTAEQHWGRTTRNHDAHSCDAYGRTPGQLGNESGDTFWSAASAIVRQCHAVLKPGGVAVWVVKAFVRDKRLVDFPGDWLRLCEAAGFRLVCRHRAMLVREQTVATLFDGPQKRRKERKSFFRRLAEKNGSPPIDHEDILCLRRE